MTPPKFLTPKQKQILDFINQSQRENGYAPSQQEIAQHFGYSSLGTVQHYLNQLKEQGLLQKEWNARRGLSVVSQQDSSEAGVPASTSSLVGSPSPGAEEIANPLQHSLPLLGLVAAGRPIEAAQDLGRVEVPPSLLRKSGEHFVLRVRGNSMIEDGILDGDFVVIRKQASAENGETVVALIDNEATIKRYERKQGRVELHAANPAYPTIQVDPLRRFRIEGVMAGLIRRTGRN